MTTRTHAENLELVYRSYEKGLDLELAFDKLQLSADERAALAVDSVLLARIAICDADFREDLILQLRDLKTTQNEQLKFAVIKELGRIKYPKVFKDTLDVNVPKPITHRVEYLVVDPLKEPEAQTA